MHTYKLTHIYLIITHTHTHIIPQNLNEDTEGTLVKCTGNTIQEECSK